MESAAVSDSRRWCIDVRGLKSAAEISNTEESAVATTANVQEKHVAAHYKNLRVVHSDAVATITLHRPEKRNALTPQMIDEILQALDEIEACSCGVLVITGAGDAFCAGLDLEHLKAMVGKSLDEHRTDADQVARLMRRIYDFPKPTIAAVNGPAIAGGTGIVSVCDFAYAVPQAKFGYTEVRIGFVPAIVSSFLVPQVGERVARDLLLTGRIFQAQEALEFGLINKVVESGQMMACVSSRAKALLANSPASLTATKKLLSSYARARLDFELTNGLEENAGMRKEKDFLEGVAAFLEHRPPVWPSQVGRGKHS
jgi:methylglutaconyl-CoA hydratase